MDLVSIIVPCHNAAAFLGETLDTVLAQSFTEWECVIVDDASSDGSVELIARYAGADARFRPVYRRVNGGAAAARNEGVAEARGRYLAFLDADDRWLPSKLAHQVSFMAETGAALSHTSYRFIDEGGRPLRGGVLASDRVDLRRYMRNTEIGMSTSLIDLDQVGSISFRDIRLCQDTHLWLSLLRRGFVSRGLRETLVEYRVRRNQISASKLGMARQVFALYREIGEVGPLERMFCFASYAWNGFRKRLSRPA